MVEMKITIEAKGDGFADIKQKAALISDAVPSDWVFKKAITYRTETGRAIDLKFTSS